MTETKRGGFGQDETEDEYEKDAARRAGIHAELWKDEPLEWWQELMLRGEYV